MKKNNKQDVGVWQVNIIESERGWGQKLDETLYFKTEKSALSFVVKHNSKNILSTAPEIYWYAENPKFVKKEKGMKIQ